MPSKKTPLGVVIIAVLMIIGGIIDILNGASLLLGSAFIPAWWFIEFAFAGVIYLIWGIIILIAAFSLMNLRHWAWTLVVVVNIINIVISIVFGGIISLIISLIIVVYLFYQRELFH
ncbi:MAG: hypothetical protein QW327_03720 [Candidatus Odinarchaeota archaeon]